MDRLRQKGKKDKTSFISDVKSIKENLKIKEILRTVKMNSSMRLKAPPGSKIMDNKDFNDNEDFFEESSTNEDQERAELDLPSATNPNVLFSDNKQEFSEGLDKYASKGNVDDEGQILKNVSTEDTENELKQRPDGSFVKSQEKNPDKTEEAVKHKQHVCEASEIFQTNPNITGQSEQRQVSTSEVKEQLDKQPVIQSDEQPIPQSPGPSIEHSEQNSAENIEVTSKFVKNENKDIRYNSDECTKDQINKQKKQEQTEQLDSQSEVLLENHPKEETEISLAENCQKPSETPLVVESQTEEKLLCDKQFTENSGGQLNELKEEHQLQEQPEVLSIQQCIESDEQKSEELEDSKMHLEKEPDKIINSNQNVSDVVVIVDALDVQHLNEIPKINPRNRKLSLDHSMLTGREGLSQSEVDLHSLGKSPLERKSSFFRKKMDSFLRNTTEMFKKQSSSSKSQSIQRRGSMSVSLQSLNERTSRFNSDYSEGTLKTQQEEFPSSMTSLNSSLTLGRSTSSVSVCHSDVLNQRGSEQNLIGSQPTLHVTHALGDYPSNSVHSLNESYLHDTLLQNRAISMSSGLDSQSLLRRKKSSSSNRSNRVTWVASEGLTNYFRRMIQDENSKKIQEGQTYQDYSIPENKSYSKPESKGRRLSYQRAVSGEDPVLPLRYHDSSFRRRPLPDHYEENPEISAQLQEYSESGVPELQGFEIYVLSDAARETLAWAQNKMNIEEFAFKEASGKQTVLCELISTEADYLLHLQVMVEVFLAAAHGLQDDGKMLELSTGRVFLNIPDIYNTNLKFWEVTFHPMIQAAFENGTPFEARLMEWGFLQMKEIFAPYEKYALAQPRANEYLRTLATDVNFATYLSWCHAHKGCQRLQITDLLVKPIQRVTKYSLILKRVAQFADNDIEQKSVDLMELAAKTYVADLNRSVKQSQELEKADYFSASVENIDADSLQTVFQEFKDEEMDDYYRIFSQSHLRAPMLNCHCQHARTVVHEGDLRFKDGSKEIEVRAILFTDMLLICKKQSKGSSYPYKMIRPKYMIDKLVDFPKYVVRNNSIETNFIFIVMVDDFGSCCTSFTLTESSKDPNGAETLKLWELKIKEAHYTYSLAVWLYFNPSHHINELDQELALDYNNSGAKQRQLSYEEYNIEREAKERVATMLHRTLSPSASLERSPSHLSIPSDIANMSLSGHESIPVIKKVPGIDVLRNRWKRPSRNCSSRNSRMSSFQKSNSGASYDECQAGSNKHIHRAGSSVEHTLPYSYSDDGSSGITVQVMKDNESESEMESTNNTTQPSTSRSPVSSNTLQVQNTTAALVHSMPDLSLSGGRRSRRSPSPMSASEKLYQAHQEHLKSRLTAPTQYLSPDNRGSSYPPPNPNRASLKRGLAFSYSLQKPTLSKMGHVASQNALDQIEPAPLPSPVKSEKGFVAKLLPGASAEKQEKEKAKEKKSKLGRKEKGGKDRKGQGRGLD